MQLKWELRPLGTTTNPTMPASTTQLLGSGPDTLVLWISQDA